MGFGDAHGEGIPPVCSEVGQVGAGLFGEFHAGGVVEFPGDGGDIGFQAVGGVVEGVGGGCGVDGGKDRVRQVGGPCPTVGPHVARHEGDVIGLRPVGEPLLFDVRVRREGVKRHHWFRPEFAHVFHVAGQVSNAWLEGVQVFGGELVAGESPVVFQGADCCHDHDCGYVEITGAGFDVEEFFRPQVGAETAFGEDHVGVR